MKRLIDLICKSRLTRDNRGCQKICNLMKKGWLYGIRSYTSRADIVTAEYLDTQRFRNM